MSKQVPRSPPSTGFLGCFTQPAGVSVCSPAWTGAQRSSPRTSNIIDAFMFASIVVCSILPPRILARSHHCRQRLWVGQSVVAADLDQRRGGQAAVPYQFFAVGKRHYVGMLNPLFAAFIHVSSELAFIL